MMGRFCLSLLSAGAILAQQGASLTTRAIYDLHGRPVPSVATIESRSDSDYRRTELIENLNGRSVPIQTVQERVISEEGGVKVVERIFRRFDPNGRPGPPDRTLIQQRTNPDGSSSVLEIRYRGDVNNRYQLWERARTEITRDGPVERSETQLDRVSPNAGMELAEKTTTLTTTTEARTEQEVVTYRRSESGRLYQAAREVTDRVTSDGQTQENVALYEAQVPGQLRFVQQTVSRTVAVDAGARTEVEIYSADIPGRPRGERQLREQQLKERKATPGGGFVETVSARHPSPDDPKKLGQFRKVSEIVCLGDCDDVKAPAAPPAQP